MRTYDLHSEDGALRAFEVENVLLSRRRACRIAASIPGAVLLRRSRPFLDTDDFCEFSLDGETFVIEEPFGDNSRYWVGTKSPPRTAALLIVREAFRRHRTLETPLRILVAAAALLGIWLAYPRVASWIAQDRCLDSGGRWNSEQACDYAPK